MTALAVLGAAVIGAAAPAPSPSPSSSATAFKAVIQDYAFKPATITVAAGTEITWTNQDDDPHTVTADDGSFDSKGLGQGDTFRKRFDKPGKYPYHCSAHPFMKGVVIVTDGDAR